MKFLAMMTSTVLLVFIGVFVAVGASGYNSHSSYPREYKSARYGTGSSSSYSSAGSYSPVSTRHSANNYGPYHSYAVKPALYGGHSFYTYRGYARHPIYKPLPPSNSYKKNNNQYKFRPVKAVALSVAYPSHSSFVARAPRYHPAPAYSKPLSHGHHSHKTPRYGLPSYSPPRHGYQSYRAPSYRYGPPSYDHPRPSYKQAGHRYRSQPSYGAGAPHSKAASGY